MKSFVFHKSFDGWMTWFVDDSEDVFRPVYSIQRDFQIAAPPGFRLKPVYRKEIAFITPLTYQREDSQGRGSHILS